MQLPRIVDPIAAATYFVGELGFTAFPVYGARSGRCLCGDPHDGTRRHGPENVAKHPATPNGFKDATADLERIRTFLQNPGTPNYGLNAPEGVLAFDVDGAGLAHWAELERLYGELPVTFTTLTANGRHYFFRWPASAGPMPAGKLLGFVVRRHDDGYVIGPGSVHASGAVYDTLRQPDGMPYPIAEIPARWIEATRKTNVIQIGGRLPAVGERHDWLRNRARYYRGFMDDPAVLRAAVLAENARLPEPKSEAAVDTAIGDVFLRFPADPPEEREERTEHHLREEELGLLEAPTIGQFPEAPDPAAFGGLLGECVSDLADGTDASLVGLLGALIAATGALVPGFAYFHRQQTSSPFVALVGESAVGRKGTAMIRALDAMSDALEATPVNRAIMDGLNSGEGLVSALYYRREHFPHEPTVGLVFEEEYATLLASRGRDGSTLDPKMRQAFDGGPLSNRRSGETKTVMPPYWLPALIGITPVELRARLEPGALQSGSANRWLYLPVTRRERIATNAAPRFDDEHRERLLTAHREAVKRPPLLGVDKVVTTTLAEYADFLPSVSCGLARDLTRRLGMIAFRIALVHALAERSVVVTMQHLERAIALTEYARRGIEWVFGDTVGNPDATLLFRHLVAVGHLSQTTITRQIIRDPLRRQAAIDELLRLGRARVEAVHTSGRPRSELRPTAERGAFVHFFQGSNIPQRITAENVEGMEESAQGHGKKVEISGKEGGGKVQEVTVWASPCYWYQDHKNRHRLTPEGWVCDACKGDAT